MKRRGFLQTVISTVGALITGTAIGKEEKKPDGLEEQQGEHFWLHTHGLVYRPSEIDSDWFNSESGFIGVYAGTEIRGRKASECQVYDLLLMPDNRQFRCWMLCEGFYRKGSGIYRRK